MPVLTPELLLRAYAMGIFPMAEHRDDPEIFWVDPRRRGVMPLDGFHISRSLAKAIRRDDYRITINQDFAGTVDGCADRDNTWISAPIRSLYIALHHKGFAHSMELWQDERLMGGVYGVSLGGAFFGESMFSRRRDASKIVLAWLVDHLRQSGFTLFDTQFLTDHLQSLGGVEITRAEYHRQLEKALTVEASFAQSDPDSSPLASSGSEILQRMTQTS